jgi:prepilin-type N-terminal cleavage/methylation domain-containing protein
MLKGFSLIELILAIGLFAILVAGSVGIINLNNNSVRLASEYDTAYSYLNAGVEGIRSLKKQSWSNLDNGDHGLIIDSGNYVLQNDPDNWNKYTRTIEISNGYSADVKEIKVTVSWDFSPTKNESISETFFLTNWAKATL